MSSLSITYRKISDLHPRANNPRTHSRKQIAQIASSIQRFGFTNPVLIDEQDAIVAGHGRVEGADRLMITLLCVAAARHELEAGQGDESDLIQASPISAGRHPVCRLAVL